MAKKTVVKSIVEPKTDAQKLAELMGTAATVDCGGVVPSEEVIPTIPVEDNTPVVEPTPVPQTSAATAEQVLAFLTANPEFLRTALAPLMPQGTIAVTSQPTVTKSTRKIGRAHV